MNRQPKAQHLSPSLATAYTRGELPEAQQMRIESHLADCSKCVALLWRARGFARIWCGLTPANYREAHRATETENLSGILISGLERSLATRSTEPYRERLRRWLANLKETVWPKSSEAVPMEGCRFGAVAWLGELSLAGGASPIGAVRTRGAVRARGQASVEVKPLASLRTGGIDLKVTCRRRSTFKGQSIEVSVTGVSDKADPPLIILIPRTRATTARIAVLKLGRPNSVHFIDVEPGIYCIAVEPM